jgi:hypothetical protein
MLSNNQEVITLLKQIRGHQEATRRNTRILVNWFVTIPIVIAILSVLMYVLAYSAI